MSQWRVLVARTLTGEIMAEVEPAEVPTYSREINKTGAITVRVPLRAQPNNLVDLHTYTRPGMYSWIVARDQHIVQAGPVWTYQINDTDRTVDIGAGGLLSLFDRRVTRNPAGHTAIVDPSEDLVYTDLSLRGIMRQLVADNMAQTGYGLPVVLPETETGEATRTYYGYALKSIADNMADLSQVIDGPDFDFAPEFSASGTHVQWRLDLGTPQLGDPDSATVWDYGTEHGPLDTLDVDVDGADAPTTRVWVKGEGTERALLTGFAEDLGLLAQGYPATDYVNADHVSVVQQSTLEGYADAYLDEYRIPPETWSAELHIAHAGAAEYAPSLGTWSLGDAPLFAVQQHSWLADGMYRRRILGFANGSHPDAIKLILAEAPESGSGL